MLTLRSGTLRSVRSTTHAARQAELEAAGERVLRTTAEQAIREPRQLIGRLHAAGAPYTDAQS